MKLTAWFSPKDKPVRVGWYEVRCPLNCGKHYWDGKFWHDSSPGQGVLTMLNPQPWRGVLK